MALFTEIKLGDILMSNSHYIQVGNYMGDYSQKRPIIGDLGKLDQELSKL